MYDDSERDARLGMSGNQNEFQCRIFLHHLRKDELMILFVISSLSRIFFVIFLFIIQDDDRDAIDVMMIFDEVLHSIGDISYSLY